MKKNSNKKPSPPKKSDEKKIASFTPKEKKEAKTIWDYKPHIIVGVVIVAAIIIFYFVFKNINRNPALEGTINSTQSPIEKENPETGTLVVETTPAGAIAQVFDKTLRTPATFKNLPEGEYIVILKYPRMQTVEKHVNIKKQQTTKLNVELK